MENLSKMIHKNIVLVIGIIAAIAIYGALKAKAAIPAKGIDVKSLPKLTTTTEEE